MTYYKDHREERLAYGKKYYQANKEKLLANSKEYQKAYRKANREKARKYQEAYRKANREKILKAERVITGRRVSEPGIIIERRSAYTISEFCTANRMSRGQLYKMWNTDPGPFGTGPRYFLAGTKRLITVTSETDWHRQREAAAAQEVA
jgi:hypothetical protein